MQHHHLRLVRRLVCRRKTSDHSGYIPPSAPTHIPAHIPDANFTEAFRTDASSGGIALKITTVDDGLYTGAAQQIFSYSLDGTAVWCVPPSLSPTLLFVMKDYLVLEVRSVDEG